MDILKLPTLGIKDVAGILGKTEGRIRQLLNKMDESELEFLGVYKNSSGWQIPPSALEKEPLSNLPGSGRRKK